MKSDIIYPKLSYLVTGICFQVHNELRRYGKEKQYGDLLESKFINENIKYKREYYIINTRNILDFIVENKIILELKAKKFITKEDYYQTQRYLQSTNLKLALLINFRNKYLKPIRIVKIDTNYKSKFI
ncbi:GxxExxY protein [bacterium]|nr:GxxExxY protein [bacterium]